MCVDAASQTSQIPRYPAELTRSQAIHPLDRTKPFRPEYSDVLLLATKALFSLSSSYARVGKCSDGTLTMTCRAQVLDAKLKGAAMSVLGQRSITGQKKRVKRHTFYTLIGAHQDRRDSSRILPSPMVTLGWV